MLGVAIGDALGLARNHLQRRVALKMFGRPPLSYRLVPGRGIYSDDSQLMFLSAQALLQSRSDLRAFRRYFQKRLRWYQLSMPVGIGKATSLSALKCWLAVLKISTGVKSADNSAATRAMFAALATHGTGHRLSRWVEETTTLTHTDPLAVDGCQVLAMLTDLAATTKPDKFDALQALSMAISTSSQEELRANLQELLPFLELRRSPSTVARHFNWDTCVGSCMVSTTTMAVYCWLRYPTDFRRAVESAITLGGDSGTIAAIVGGLVGAHVGVKHLPRDLVDGLRNFPHDNDWIKKMAERFSHWPHGPDDLHSAPALPSDPPAQLIRNILNFSIVLLHRVARLPFRAFTSSTPKRLRR